MAKIIKAKSITHAKRGYFVFSGEYPNMKISKYITNKKEAIKLKNKWNKKNKLKKMLRR